MKKRPPTKLMRIRINDLQRMRELSKQTNKSIPDLQRMLIKFYRKRK